MRASLALVLAALISPTAALAQDGDAADTAQANDGATQASATVEEGQPRYLAAMQAELSSMRLRDASCEATDEQRAHCAFTAHGVTTNRDFEAHMVYSDRTDTIYLYVDHYLVATPDADGTPAVLRRLMELNWSLLLGKFEWDATDGEVRLAMILNTDSNFDRRAFRSAVRGIGQLADRYYNELERLTH